MKKYLNLYGGIGGNIKLIDGVKVTCVEKDPAIAALYSRLYPDHEVVIADAHQFLLDHFSEFDIAWSSPPCQSHSRLIRSGRNRKPRYPDFKLYEEIMFLKHNFKGVWVVENVIPYYEPLMKPVKIGRHLFWSNVAIDANFKAPEFKDFINRQNLENKKQLHEWLDIHFDEKIYYDGNHCPTQILRNAVHPLLGKHVFDCLNLACKKTVNGQQPALFSV